VLLVDGGSVATSEALLAAAAALPDGGPVRTLFNTHWHPEHTGANVRLGAEGAMIVAQQNTRLWLTTDVTWPWNGETVQSLPAAALPNKPFYTRDELAVAGRRVLYGHLPDAPHTDGDLYVHFPDDNVLAVGGAVSSAGWQMPDWWTGGWIGGIVGGLDHLLTLTDDETLIVPSEGPVIGRAELRAQYDMYGAVFERLARLLYSGHGPAEAVAEKPAAEFEAKMGPAEAFVDRAFRSLWAYLSPDA
jgi:cyclase